LLKRRDALPQKSFNEILAEAIDDSLSSLGESVKQVIYFHLEENFHLPKEEIPDRVEEFSECLEKIFGPGANFIKILIMKKLYKRLGRPSFYWDSSKEFTFTEYVEIARRSFADR